MILCISTYHVTNGLEFTVRTRQQVKVLVAVYQQCCLLPFKLLHLFTKTQNVSHCKRFIKLQMLPATTLYHWFLKRQAELHMILIPSKKISILLLVTVRHWNDNNTFAEKSFWQSDMAEAEFWHVKTQKKTNTKANRFTLKTPFSWACYHFIYS